MNALPKPYYQDGSCTLYRGNCLEIGGLVSGLIDCTITDPPYGTTSLEWDVWQDGWLEMCAGSGKALWCFGTARMFWDHYSEFSAWKLAQEVIWEKQNGSGLHADRFRLVHENVWNFYPKGVAWNSLYHAPVISMDATRRRVKRAQKPAHWGALKSAGTYEVEEGGPRLMRSVIFCRNMHRRALHPTQKPEELVTSLVLSSCPQGGTVFDPFAGSGTTLRVAKNLGRKAIGIEIDEKSCETSAKRLQQEVLAL